MAHGAHAASSTAPNIRAMFGGGERRSVGIATGKVSGIVVLDVDPAHGGDESLAALERAHGPLPATATVRTGGGGRHLYFQHPGGEVRNSAGKLGPGLDVRGDGGYVVAPPSRHASGRRYRWVDRDAEIAPLPGWLRDLVLNPRPPRTGASFETSGASPSAPGSTTPYGRRVLDRATAAVRESTEGRRNDELNGSAFRVARRVAGGEISDREARSGLLAAARGCGLGEDEALRTIESAFAAGLQKPRTAPAGADGPTIHVSSDLVGMTDAALRALVESDSGLYTRAGILVRVVECRSRTSALLRRPDGAPVIVPAPRELVLERLAAAARFVKGTKRVLPPRVVVATILARGSWELPQLEGIVEAPALQPDGRILETIGYDAAAGLIYRPAAEFPAVPSSPTAAEVGTALETLAEPFRDFPFVQGCDRVAAIAALLTMIARRAVLGPVPLFAVRATSPGTGKTLLVEVISTIATGRTAARVVPGRGEDETRKLIATIGLEGAPVVLLDNVDGALGSPVLSAALTSATIQDRILGASRLLNVSLLGTCWFATGNGLSFKGDFGRRVVPIDLDAGVENPEDRGQFRHPDLVRFARDRRAEIVAAALTVLRAFVVAGRPRHDRSRMGSFEDWDDLIRGACIWASIGDPCEGRLRIREEGDADLEVLREALAAWAGQFGERAMSAAEVVEGAAHHPALRAALAALAGVPMEKLDARQLGYALRRVFHRIVGGRHFDKASRRAHGGNVRWCVCAASRADLRPSATPPQGQPTARRRGSRRVPIVGGRA